MPDQDCVSMNIHSLHEDYFCLKKCAEECDVCYGITRVENGERFERTGCGCFTLDAPPSESCAGDQWPKQCADSCWRCAPCYHPLTKADFYPEIRFHKPGHGDYCDGQCGAWQGDCDFDADCKPGLVCGLNNCPQTLINTYLNSRGNGDVHPDAPAHIDIPEGYTTIRAPDCCIYPADRMSGTRKGDSLAWGNYVDYTKQDFGPYDASMAVGPEVTVGSVAIALGSTAGVVSLFCICGLMYWYCVRPRARHKRSRKYLPDMVPPNAPELKRGWGSLSEVDTNAGSDRADTPLDALSRSTSDLKFSGPRDRRAAEEIPLRELTKSQRAEQRRDSRRRRDVDELPAAGVLQSPDPRSPPKRLPEGPVQKPSLPTAFPEALVEAEKQKPPPPPPPLPARFQQPMRDNASDAASNASSPQRERRIAAGSRPSRVGGAASDTMSETGRTELSDRTDALSQATSRHAPSIAGSTHSRGAGGRSNRREVTERRSRRDMERLQEDRRLEMAGIDEHPAPGPTVVTAANVRSPAGRRNLGSPAGSTGSAPGRPTRLPAAPPQLQHY